jgi:hypothetical protein
VADDRRAALTELSALLQTIPNQVELQIVATGTRSDEIARTLQRGQIIAAALRREGLRQAFPILVNREVAYQGRNTLILRVTRFRAGTLNP